MSDLFESLRQTYEGLKNIAPDQRKPVLQTLIAQLEAMVAQGEAQGATSANETLEDLNEESIPFLLARFYLAMTISNYVTDQPQRYQAVKLARAHLTQFIDDCM